MQKTKSILILSLILSLSLALIIPLDAEAAKAKGTSASRIGVDKICGDKICDYVMTDDEKLGYYLLNFLEIPEDTVIQQSRFMMGGVAQQEFGNSGMIGINSGLSFNSLPGNSFIDNGIRTSFAIPIGSSGGIPIDSFSQIPNTNRNLQVSPSSSFNNQINNQLAMVTPQVGVPTSNFGNQVMIDRVNSNRLSVPLDTANPWNTFASKPDFKVNAPNFQVNNNFAAGNVAFQPTHDFATIGNIGTMNPNVFVKIVDRTQILPDSIDTSQVLVQIPIGVHLNPIDVIQSPIEIIPIPDPLGDPDFDPIGGFPGPDDFCLGPSCLSDLEDLKDKIPEGDVGIELPMPESEVTITEPCRDDKTWVNCPHVSSDVGSMTPASIRDAFEISVVECVEDSKLESEKLLPRIVTLDEVELELYATSQELDPSICYTPPSEIIGFVYFGGLKSDMKNENFDAQSDFYEHELIKNHIPVKFSHVSSDNDAVLFDYPIGNLLTSGHIILVSYDYLNSDAEEKSTFTTIKTEQIRDLSNLVINDYDFTGDLSSIKFKDSTLLGSDFSNSNLNHADFTGATLVGNDFSGADMSYVKLNSVSSLLDSQHTSIHGCKTCPLPTDNSNNFDNTNLSHASISSSDLSSSSMSETILTDATISNTDLGNITINNANFENANLFNFGTPDLGNSIIQGLNVDCTSPFGESSDDDTFSAWFDSQYRLDANALEKIRFYVSGPTVKTTSSNQAGHGTYYSYDLGHSGKLRLASCLNEQVEMTMYFDRESDTPDQELPFDRTSSECVPNASGINRSSPSCEYVDGFWQISNTRAYEFAGPLGGKLFSQFEYVVDGETYYLNDEVKYAPVVPPDTWWDCPYDCHLDFFMIPEEYKNEFKLTGALRDDADDVINSDDNSLRTALDNPASVSLDTLTNDNFKIFIDDEKEDQPFLSEMAAKLGGYGTDFVLNAATFGVYGTVTEIISYADTLGFIEVDSASLGEYMENTATATDDDALIYLYSEKYQSHKIVIAGEKEDGKFVSPWIRTDDITDLPGDRIIGIYSNNGRVVSAILDVVD